MFLSMNREISAYCDLYFGNAAQITLYTWRHQNTAYVVANKPIDVQLYILTGSNGHSVALCMGLLCN